MATDLWDAAAGGMWGLLVGDAVGVPYEFQFELDELPPDLIDMPPPLAVVPSHPAAPAQAWSDDGAHALCLLASLLERGRLDLQDLGDRLLRWLDDGYLAVGGVVFDVGMQTHTALVSLRRGVPADRAGPAGERDNGNGSLMRVLPLALWHRGSDDEVIRDAALQSRVTHGHLRAQICCALYCLWVRGALRGVKDPWAAATLRLRELSAPRADWIAELDRHIRPEAVPSGTGSGYVVDCLASARLAAAEPTFERVIRKAVSLGDDTDTTAAVAGGFAGVRHGLSGIPQRWLAALAERELAASLIQRLLEHLRPI
jgi:ADP-ribosylglycohydrolase